MQAGPDGHFLLLLCFRNDHLSTTPWLTVLLAWGDGLRLARSCSFEGFTSVQTLRRSQSAYWCLFLGLGASGLRRRWMRSGCCCWLVVCVPFPDPGVCPCCWWIVLDGIPGFLGAVWRLCVS